MYLSNSNRVMSVILFNTESGFSDRKLLKLNFFYQKRVNNFSFLEVLAIFFVTRGRNEPGDGDDRMGEKSRSKKIPRTSNKTPKKSLDQQLTPKKFPCMPNFRALKFPEKD